MKYFSDYYKPCADLKVGWCKKCKEYREEYKENSTSTRTNVQHLNPSVALVHHITTCIQSGIVSYGMGKHIV